MSYVFLLIAVVIGLILQSTYFEIFRVVGVKPDAVLLVVIFYAIQNGPRKGALFGFVAGLIEDIFTAKFLGLHAVLKAVIGLSVGLLEKRVFKENIFIPALLSIPATFAQEAGYIIIRQLAGYLTRETIPFTKSVSVLALYHFILALVGYHFYNRLADKRIFPRPQRRY